MEILSTIIEVFKDTAIEAYVSLIIIGILCIWGFFKLRNETRTTVVQDQNVLIQSLMEQNKILSLQMKQLQERQDILEKENERLRKIIIKIRIEQKHEDEDEI